MKTNTILALSMLAILVSCSPSDDNSGTATTDYFPLTQENYWNYDIPESGGTPGGRDSLYVGNDTVINSKTYQRFNTGAIPIGFYSNSLNGNGVRKDGDRLLLSGGAGLDLAAAFPVDITLDDFVVFDESATPNETLDTFSGTINQTFQDIPLTIDYSLKSTSMESFPTYTSPNGDAYTDVKSVKTTLNIKVVAQIEVIPGFILPVTVMESQDVVTSTQYFAKNIGVVYSNTNITYSLSQEIPGSEVPTTGSQTQQEFLDTYSVN